MSDGNVYFLTHDQREAVLWAIRLGLWRIDDGFPVPRDQNREILRSVQSVLDGSWKEPHPYVAPLTDVDRCLVCGLSRAVHEAELRGQAPSTGSEA